MSYSRTGTWAISKRLQYIEEVTYGVTPTASPTFIHAGKIRSFNWNIDTQVERYRTLGSRLLADALVTGELTSFEIEYNPINIALLGYGINNPDGTGTIAKSLSFIYSKEINGVEMYYFIKGAKTDSISIEVTPENVSVTQSFIAREITTPTTTHGLTTPTFASNPTTNPWIGFSGGATPLVHNSNTYDVPSFNVEVSWNLDPGQANGQQQIKFLDPTNKDVNLDFEWWQKDAVLIADIKSGTERAMTYTLHSTDAKLTFTDVVGETYDMSEDSDANETSKEGFAGFATDVVVAAV